jgi:hypothetical protein
MERVLTRKGIDHLFFSAHVEQKKIDKEASRAKRKTSFDEEKKVVVLDEDENDVETRESNPALQDLEQVAQQPSDESLGVTNPLTREELLCALDAFAESHGCSPEEKYDNRIKDGIFGFPNGKCCLCVL